MKKIFLFLLILGMVTPVKADLIIPRTTAEPGVVADGFVNTDKKWWKEATPELVEQMLANGADVNAEYNMLQTPLVMALKTKNFAVADTLIKHGADVNAKVHGYTLLMLVGDDPDVFSFLTKNGSKTNESSPELIVRAAESNDLNALNTLIKDGGDVNASVMGVTPLISAAKMGNLSAVEILIKNGADVNAAGFADLTPLMVAAESNEDTAVIETLIQNGADVNALNASGETALMRAVSKNEKNPRGVIAVLVKNGAKTDIKGKLSGRTVLQAAVQGRNIEAVKALLESGVDPNDTKSSDLDAVRSMPEMKALANQPELKKLVESRLTKGNITPLMLAVQQDNDARELVELLIKYGADVNAKDANGKTALDYAKREDRTDLYPLLK